MDEESSLDGELGEGEGDGGGLGAVDSQATGGTRMADGDVEKKS